MGSGGMDGARVLVVGASSGIGRAFALAACEMGADVCVSSRRQALLEELCAEMGAGHAVPADVTEAAAAERLVGQAAEAMGGIDLVLYTAGAARLRPLAVAQADDWRLSYEVNVVGPALVTQAALPVLSADGLVSYISSESAGEVRWGLGAYAASKAALDTAIRYWRHEHPERRFQRVIMGATMPTGFGDAMGESPWLGSALERWAKVGIDAGIMEVGSVGRQLAEVLSLMLGRPDVDVPDIYLDPRGQPWPDEPGG